jgi:hypothetical protein
MTEYLLCTDDSGHPSDQTRVVAAGFLASAEQWETFEPKWLTALHNYRLGDAFHMTDFEATKRRDRGSVLQHLIEINFETCHD